MLWKSMLMQVQAVDTATIEQMVKRNGKMHHQNFQEGTARYLLIHLALRALQTTAV